MRKELLNWRALGIACAVSLAGCGSGEPVSSKPASRPATTDSYPLDICVVSGKKLGSMGDPFIGKHNGRTVKFCCSDCIKEFNSNPAKYMAILDEAEKKQAK